MSRYKHAHTDAVRDNGLSCPGLDGKRRVHYFYHIGYKHCQQREDADLAHHLKRKSAARLFVSLRPSPFQRQAADDPYYFVSAPSNATSA